MSFQPEKAGPVLLATIHKILVDHGLDPSHIELCYDGQEDANTYSTSFHLHPYAHSAGHSFNLARALRAVAPESDNPDVNGLFIRFFTDGTMVIAPAVVGINSDLDTEEDDKDDD